MTPTGAQGVLMSVYGRALKLKLGLGTERLLKTASTIAVAKLKTSNIQYEAKSAIFQEFSVIFCSC